MSGQMVLYRGSLKSCNYQCSYCPFSKHAMPLNELEKDREQWTAFVSAYAKHAEESEHHALMIVPYGEALIHPWYIVGLARVSALAGTDAAGAQTNLGYSVKKLLDDFRNAGGITRKLRLWATFHPEMTTVAEFAEKCRFCMETGVKICAGAVGVPEHTELLMQLRKALPEEIYLWVNKMDGLGRPYTDEEKTAFADIDPYFFRELLEHRQEVTECQRRIFVQGDGKRRLCNLSGAFDSGRETFLAQNGMHGCKKKRCSCYLAYGGRENLQNQMLFGPYPLFRIPRRPKAVFLDIDGTLLPKKSVGRKTGEKKKAEPDGISEELRTGLKVLAERERTLLFLATARPYEEAYKRLENIWQLFAGGVFAGGAHVLWKGRKEQVYFLEEGEECLQYLKLFQAQFHFRVLVYRKDGRCYKITLLRAGKKPWDVEEADALMEQVPAAVRKRVRYFIEENCMQITRNGADKAGGVRLLCKWSGISPKEAFAAGDSALDAQMIEMCVAGKILSDNIL